MKLSDLFTIPKLPTEPVALKAGRPVSQGEFIESLKPLDVGLTRGAGGLGWWENLLRVKTKEGPNLMTHAFLQYGPGTIAESNWPCVTSGKQTSIYLGGKRHTVLFRYQSLTESQVSGGLSTIDTFVAARVPYAGFQILGFLPEFLGGKPAGNRNGVICSEFDTIILREQHVPFAGDQPSWNVSPSDAMTWLMAASAFGWEPVAEAIGERYWVAF